jgi:Antirestriction protein
LIRQVTNDPALQNWTPIASQPVTSWRTNGVYKELLRSGVVLALGGPHVHVYTMFDYMAPGTRCKGRWRMHATSNGSFYLVPSLAAETIELCGPRTGHTATLAAEGAGIAATLFAFMDMADGPLGADPYNNLLAFAEQHPEGDSIGKLL